MKLSALLDKALSLIFPKRCVFCSEFAYDLACEKCVLRHSEVSPPVCSVCGHGDGCCNCRTGLFYDRLTAPFYYEGRVREDILDFKYHGKHDYGDYFASFICASVGKHYGDVVFDAVTCVPAYKIKNLNESFDHAQYLGRAVAKELGIKFNGSLLNKCELREKQHTLGFGARIENVKGLYIAGNERLDGKIVLIIDDISTSGATFSECARVLKEMGASHVYCASAALTKRKQFCGPLM